MSTQTRSPIDDIRSTLGKMGDQFRAVMPTQQHVDRFIRVVMTAVQSNPDLVHPETNRQTFYAACMKCAQDGLLPDGKQAVLKIYNTKVGKDSWEKQVQYEPMTDGMMIKLRNSGEIVGAPKVHCWYANDAFSYELGDNEGITHKPAIGDRGALCGAYSIVKLKSGDTSREVMSISEIDGIMARTKSKDKEGNVYGPWKTDKPEMARKTVFKRHCKRLPRSTDLDNMINEDNEVNGIEGIPARGAPAPAALPAPGQAGGEPMPTGSVSSSLKEKVVGGGSAAPAGEAKREDVEQERDVL